MKLAVFLVPMLVTVFTAPIAQNDSEKKLRTYLKWLTNYNYYQNEHGEVDDIPESQLEEVIKVPLIEWQNFYGYAPADGILTDEVISIMNQPRCGDVDIPLEPHGLRTKRWSRLSVHTWKDLPVTINFKTYLSQRGTYAQHGISPELQRDVMTECAELWSQESGLSFKLLARGIGDIEVSFKHLDGMWNQVGSALSPTPWWPADKPSWLTLDNSERWRPRRESWQRPWYASVSMKWAMCHELGHSIGIGHSSNRNAIMFVTSTYQDERRLHSDDRAAVQALYGEPNGKTVEVEWGSKYHPDRRPTPAPTTRLLTTRTTTQSTAKTTTTTAPTTTTTRPTTSTTTTPTTTTTRLTTSTTLPTTTTTRPTSQNVITKISTQQTSTQTPSNITRKSTTLTLYTSEPGRRFSLDQLLNNRGLSPARSAFFAAIQRRRG